MNPYVPTKSKGAAAPVAASTVTVYVVTAISLEHLRKPRYGEEQPIRTDMARFFVRKDADSFAERLHPSWTRVQVDERTEPVDAQHAAHGGKVGA